MCVWGDGVQGILIYDIFDDASEDLLYPSPRNYTSHLPFCFPNYRYQRYENKIFSFHVRLTGLL